MVQDRREALPRHLLTTLRSFFVALGLSSLVLGYFGASAYGLRTKPQHHYSFLDLLYFTLLLIPGQSQAAMPPTSAMDPAVPWELTVARFTAPCVALYTLVELAVALSAGRVRRARLRRAQNHSVVFGSGRNAAMLTRRLRELDARVLTVHRQAADGSGPECVVGDPTAPRTLADAGVAQAKTVYACHDLSQDNAEIARTVEWLRHGRSRPERVYALIADLDLCLALKARRWSSAQRGSPHLDFFNPDELAARSVVRRDRAALEPTPRIGIVGTGAFGRSVLVEFARQWHLARGIGDGPMDAVLIGGDAPQVAARLAKQYAFFGEACSVQAHTRPLDEVLNERRRAREPRLARLYLCQDDENEALKAALGTAPYLRSLVGTVVVRLDRMASMAAGFSRDREAGTLFDALGGRLRVVDVTEEGCDPRRIGDDLAETLARATHEHYVTARVREGALPGSTTSLVGWEELPEDLREANVAQAVDIGRKLTAIGCLITPRTGVDPHFFYRKGEVEALAESEHARWTAERARRGWTYGTDLDEGRRHHPNLLPWSLLSEHDRKKDREAVRALPGLLADLGLSIVRVDPPEVEDREPGTSGQPQGDSGGATRPGGAAGGIPASTLVAIRNVGRNWG